MGFAYELGRAARRHPLAVVGLASVAVFAVATMPESKPIPPASTAAPAWRAPVDPADTPERRERHRRQREAADLGAVLQRMK